MALVIFGVVFVVLSLRLVYGAVMKRAYDTANWQLLLRLSALHRLFFPYYAKAMRKSALQALGETKETLELAYAFALLPGASSDLINSSIDTLVFAGRYTDAVALLQHPVLAQSYDGDSGRALCAINAAEALYNLGQWDEALALLDRIGPAAERWPIIRAGIRQQRAWILAHLGRADEAAATLKAVNPEWVPRPYLAELHFTRAVVAIAHGELALAEKELAEAQRVAQRASSRRNALFLRGRVLALRGQLSEAERVLRAAADHPYQGQGGGGLLLWGDVLERLGRSGEAKVAWQLAIDRDPESDSARLATERLATPAAAAAS